MTEQKMTIREFLEQVILVTEDTRQDLSDFAQYRIEVLDKQNKNRKNKNSKKREENLEFLPTVLELLTDEPQPVKAIKEKLEEQGHELHSSKVTALVKLGIEQGQVEVVEPEKRSQPLGYKLV